MTLVDKRNGWTPYRRWKAATGSNTPGCYACQSTALTKIYRDFFPESGKIPVKIGYSRDILDRVLELNGLNSPRRFRTGFLRKKAYAGFNDWQLIGFRSDSAEKGLPVLEIEMHERYNRFSAKSMNQIQVIFSRSWFIPAVTEIFVAHDRDIRNDFPENFDEH